MVQQAPVDPIAIVGVGCRFPGANGPDAFWRLLVEATDAITEVPPSRFDIDSVHDPIAGTPGKVVTRCGGFLSGFDQFDAAFFGVSPREAARMDPQQRLLLEVAWEALEDAGVVVGRLRDRHVGVFVGMCNTDYWTLQCGNPSSLDVYVNVGSSPSVAAGRLSYAFGFEGPSVAINTACSSSLVAVHLACQSLRGGESTLAIAGGVNLVLTPEVSISFSQARMLSPDGRCKAFDVSADGFVRSDGVGILVLKRLADALADDDRVYAVIRGSAVNNDGRSADLLMTPSREGQEAVLRAAYRDAEIDTAKVRYIEAHGTGTSVGDPIEVGALAAVLGAHRDSRCTIGSVKSNIGHTEAAAGVAGLIKVALALRHRTLPPSLHCREPNPAIPWAAIPLAVQRELEVLPPDGVTIIAGVSSFGIAGTNAHVVVEQAPPGSTDARDLSTAAQLLALSAQSPDALLALAGSYRKLLACDDAPPLTDICYTAAARRTHHPYRLSLVAHSRDQLAECTEAFLNAMTASEIDASGSPRIVFVFPGQGAQWPAMGRALIDEKAFREALVECETAMREHVDWSLLDVLTDEAHWQQAGIDVVQPAIFAMQVAQGRLWQSWGVKPHAVIGQSMGEIAACYFAGALSLADAILLICRRSRLLRRVSGCGAMAVVGLPRNEVLPLLIGREKLLSIAISNSPGSTVLSGDTQALLDLQVEVERRGVLFRLVKVDVASHSPKMDPLTAELRKQLRDIHPRAAHTPIFSTVTGAQIDGEQLNTEYWVRNLREPVLFSDALQPLLQLERPVFVEISPHPLLAAPIQQWIEQVARPGRVLPSVRRDENGRAVMLESLGTLYTAGVDVCWSGVFPRGGRCVGLPSYPWQRESFPVQVEGTKPLPWRSGRDRHPILERSRAIAHPQTWELTLGSDGLSYLADHRIHETALVPAAAYVELALAAAEEALGAPAELERVVLHEALFLASGVTPEVRLEIDDKQTFQLSSRDGASWRLHAEGAIVRDDGLEPKPSSLDAIQARCRDQIDADEHYRQLCERGLDYGPTFRGVEQVWRRDGEALGCVRLVESLAAGAAGYRIHPALLDACFQVMFAALPRDGPRIDGDSWLPTGFARFRVRGLLPPDGSLWSHAVVRGSPDGDRIDGDLVVVDGRGAMVAEVEGLGLRRLNRGAAPPSSLDDLFYELRWELVQRARPAAAPADLSRWLILADEACAGRRLATLLLARGEPCVVATRRDLDPEVAPAVLRGWLDERFPVGRWPRGIIHMWSIDAAVPSQTGPATLDLAQRLGTASVLAWVQALAGAGLQPTPRLWVVTAGVQSLGDGREPVSVAQAPVWGLARTIGYEHPELRCTAVDVSGGVDDDELLLLSEELIADSPEHELALRGTHRYVARVARCPVAAVNTETHPLAPHQTFRIDSPAPGTWDAVQIRLCSPRPPPPGELQIRVHFVALNFIDVMRGLGIYPDQPRGPTPLGIECAGTIIAIGEHVDGFRVGDDVLAVTPASTCCLASEVNVAAPLVVRRPVGVDPAQAATLPMALLTADYALNHLARLAAGERVLIHAASGGVGLAAVQLARLAGAEILATAGSEQKREYLRSIGIAQVMDSRSTHFADVIAERTAGRGVDVVLNSLTGDAARRSLSIIAPFGRFLELGKRDIHQNRQLGLRALCDNVSYIAVDVDQLLRMRAAFAGLLLVKLFEQVEHGCISPLPSRMFPVGDVAEAFRHMAQARHVGRVVVSVRDHAGATVTAPRTVFRADATYLITGGMGALGLAAAQWMVDEGARHLLLMGRSTPSPAVGEMITRMRSTGANVRMVLGDVARENDVARMLDDAHRTMPPLRGVLHAAAILDDCVLLHLTPQRLRSVARPKIAGSWNLHSLTAHLPLDFFVLFSSAASLFGSPGQGNYVAANAFLDSLARHRRALGLHALSINWGPWSEIGLVAGRQDRGERLLARGLGSLTSTQGLAALSRLLRHEGPQVAVVPFDVSLWRRFFPSVADTPFFELVKPSRDARAPTAMDGQLTREALHATDAAGRPALVQAYLRRQLGRVVGLSPAKMAKLDVCQPLNRLGLDSLMAVELKHRIEADLGVVVPVVNLLKGPSLEQLAREVCESAMREIVVSAAGTSIAEGTVCIENLADPEVNALLKTVLADRGGTR